MADEPKKPWKDGLSRRLLPALCSWGAAAHPGSPARLLRGPAGRRGDARSPAGAVGEGAKLGKAAGMEGAAHAWLRSLRSPGAWGGSGTPPAALKELPEPTLLHPVWKVALKSSLPATDTLKHSPGACWADVMARPGGLVWLDVGTFVMADL